MSAPSFPLGGDVAFIAAPEMPLAKCIAFPEHPHCVFAHPATILGIAINLAPGTTYAWRSTAQAIVRAALRLRRPLPTWDRLRERVRHLEGVRS